MTFYILNVTTNKVISISNARIEGEPTSSNLMIDPLTAPEVVKYLHPLFYYVEDKVEAHNVTGDNPPDASTSSPKHNIPIIDTNGVVGEFFQSIGRWSTSTS